MGASGQAKKKTAIELSQEKNLAIFFYSLYTSLFSIITSEMVINMQFFQLHRTPKKRQRISFKMKKPVCRQKPE